MVKKVAWWWFHRDVFFFSHLFYEKREIKLEKLFELERNDKENEWVVGSFMSLLKELDITE